MTPAPIDIATAVNGFYDSHSRYAEWVGVVAEVVEVLEQHRLDETSEVLVIRVDPTRRNEWNRWVVEAEPEVPTSVPTS